MASRLELAYFENSKPFLATTGYNGKKDLTATAEHRAAWKAVFSQPISGGPLAVGFDEYFGTDVPNWPPYCFIENDRTVGIPSEFAASKLFEKNQASQQGPAIEDWTLEPILPTLASKAEEFIRRAADRSKEDAEEPPFLLYMPLTSPHTPLSVNQPWRGQSGLNLYADFVMETDAVVGRVLAALEKQGLADDTFVLFTSDNGCAPYINVSELEAKGHFPSGPLRGYKSDAWEGGHRVPFIVRWPGKVKPRSQCDQLVHQADLLRTLSAIVCSQLADGQGEDSFNILPLLKGAAEPVRETAISASSRGLPAVRWNQWKFIPGPGSGGWGKGGDQTQPVQLYDLSADLGESNNLAATQPKRTKQMAKLLEDLISAGRSTPGKRLRNDVKVRRFQPDLGQ